MRFSPVAWIYLGTWLAGATVANGQSPDDAADRGQEIAVEIDRRRSGFGDYRASLTMVLRDRSGDERTRELLIRGIELENGERTLMQFETPRDLRGTALLTFTNRDRDDDQWLYFPSLKRVRRIASGARSGSFMGSEFAYEDVASDEIERFDHRYVRTETVEGVDGGAAVVVERTPRDDESAYARQLVWVHAEGYRPLRVDYYDRKDRLIKTLTFSGYREHDGGFWRPARMEMVNHASGRTTLLLWSEYEFATGLIEADFDPRVLGR